MIDAIQRRGVFMRGSFRVTCSPEMTGIRAEPSAHFPCFFESGNFTAHKGKKSREKRRDENAPPGGPGGARGQSYVAGSVLRIEGSPVRLAEAVTGGHVIDDFPGIGDG